MASLCKCGVQRERRVAGPNSNFPGRPYFRCDECGSFDWADAAPSNLFSQDAGPNCACGKASVQRAVKKEGANKGRKFWSCASWPKGCRFFEWKDGSDAAAASRNSTPTKTMPPSPKKRPALPGFATWLSDWKKFEIVQNIMTVDPEMMSAHSSNNYDKLRVVGLWHISNKSRMEKYEEEKIRTRGQANGDLSRFQFPEAYVDAMRQLGLHSLDERAGEAFLLHGTDPSNLFSILFEGLDTEMARNGNFGRGLYFAENAAKIHQYAVEDRRFQKDGPLSDLHEKIYGSNHHPKCVRYALITRVLLGRHVFTKDGETQLLDSGDGIRINGKTLFADKDRRVLETLENGETPDSLVALPGGRVRTFREFVVFNPDQIFVEYLVAYHCKHSLCDCGLEYTERTVTKEGENRGRKIHLCGEVARSGGKAKCSFVQMFPLCYCGESAHVATSHSDRNPGRKFYRCNAKGNHSRWNPSCDFFEWVDSAPSSPSPFKRQRS